METQAGCPDRRIGGQHQDPVPDRQDAAVLFHGRRKQFTYDCIQFSKDACSGHQARNRAVSQNPANRHGFVFFHRDLSCTVFCRLIQNMNIILFTSRRGQARNFEISPLGASLTLLAGLMLLCAVSVWTGARLSGDELHYVAGWQEEMHRHQAELAAARETAQANLNALALRVGQIQAQMLRLNALGGRLVSKADLDGEEFNFDTEPATGGPQETAELSPAGLDDFIATLDSLDASLTDRVHKLSVLETMLMDRSLRERLMPSGRPIGKGWLSSRFGKRADPFTGKQEYHKGVDFAGKEGADVLATGDGVVTWSGRRSGYGNLVEINHGNGYVTRYGHNKSNLVEAGEAVKKGQQIALIGSTGRSTGPHVHFEVLRNGKQVNPAKFISK